MAFGVVLEVDASSDEAGLPLLRVLVDGGAPWPSVSVLLSVGTDREGKMFALVAVLDGRFMVKGSVKGKVGASVAVLGEMLEVARGIAGRGTILSAAVLGRLLSDPRASELRVCSVTLPMRLSWVCPSTSDSSNAIAVYASAYRSNFQIVDHSLDACKTLSRLTSNTLFTLASAALMRDVYH